MRNGRDAGGVSPAGIGKALVRWALCVTFLPAIAAGVDAAAGDGKTDRPLEITYLANEGFLLRSGLQAVLIDAFVEEPYSIYAAVPPAGLKDMIEGRPPFDSVRLALVSHAHRDHFQPRPAIAFLRKHPEALLASSEDVLNLIRSADPGVKDIENRLKLVLPDEGESVALKHAGIEVEVLRLSHGSGRFRAVQNLGHVIHLGGRAVLHVGDAEMRPADLEAYDLASRRIDVALVPYWFFGDGPAALKRRFPARTLVAVHVPPAEQEEVAADLARRFGEVVVFARPMERRRF